MQATRTRLDAQRWHWQHGPIDIVATAEGEPEAVAAAHEAAWQRLQPLLATLVGELPLLRQPVHAGAANPLRGSVARCMWDACAPHAAHGFITPMAAVAGSVAQALIGAYQRPGIARAWLNNGGDIALHLAPGAAVRVGVYGDLARRFGAQAAELDGQFALAAAQPVRGVATSGWRGRSLSLGIADSVTVLAASAAMADAAATVIANAVNADHPAIVRRPANELRDDSDLGSRPATAEVPPLPASVVRAALQAGASAARACQQRGLAWAVFMVCQGQRLALQPLCSMAPAAHGAFATSEPPCLPASGMVFA